MNEELAYRTIAYLIGCYKNNDETTINQEEIDAINFILNENQQLKEQLNKKYENVGTLTSEILYEENTKLVQENQQLKEKLEASEKTRKNCYEYLKNPPEDVWSGHSLEKAKELLDIDKGE